MVSADKCAKRQSPTFFSWLVVDSMSTSARVSSKRFIRIGLFWMSETKGRNHEDTNRGCCLSIALHPKLTDDSEQALDLFPNRCEFSYRCGFGGLQKSPFCTGI